MVLPCWVSRPGFRPVGVDVGGQSAVPMIECVGNGWRQALVAGPVVLVVAAVPGTAEFVRTLSSPDDGIAGVVRGSVRHSTRGRGSRRRLTRMSASVWRDRPSPGG